MQNTKDLVTRAPLKTVVNAGAPECMHAVEWVTSILVAPVVWVTSVLSHERGNNYLYTKKLYFIVLLVVTCRQG